VAFVLEVARIDGKEEEEEDLEDALDAFSSAAEINPRARSRALFRAIFVARRIS
jgi:hypothetical protein